MNRFTLPAVAALLLGGAWLFWSSSNNQSGAERAYEAAGGGTLSGAAARGRDVFNARCASCHGRDAKGGRGGPPLIHRIYEPSHHGDMAIRLKSIAKRDLEGNGSV